VLNVAEKPSVAKEVSRVLCSNNTNNGGRMPHSREGASKYNRIFEFTAPFPINNVGHCRMKFTSVTGHLMNYDFSEPEYKSWERSETRDLFQRAAIVKSVPGKNEKVKINLEREAKTSDWLILWLDCDREGENIAMEVVDVCLKANRRLKVFRARFSALSYQDVSRALMNLQRPDERASIAVDARMELDLRLGAAFTRFNTLCAKRNRILGLLDGGENGGERRERGRGRGVNDKENKNIISYGPCQFPTLGFIVQRKWDVDAHVPEKFWTISIGYRILDGDGRQQRQRHRDGRGLNNNNNNNNNGRVVEFRWNRQRVFDEHLAMSLFERVQNAPHATVLSTRGQEIKKWPPHPLNTLEMQKRLNRALRIAPEKIMNVAETLYQKGFISYPRTETDRFPDSFNFHENIALFYNHETFGPYARELIEGDGFRKPPGGHRDDKAHPPIYPSKLATMHEYNSWDREGQQVYDFVLRHFLATCSKPAVGYKTTVEVDCAGEGFKANGLMITDRAYLRIYGPGPIFPPNGPRLQPYFDNWNAQEELPSFEDGEQFQPSHKNLRDSETVKPQMLSEVDLLTLMEKNGIGTDATQAQHIEKVVGERGYAKKVGENRLVPTNIGEALVAGYDFLQLGFMWQPTKRAEMEKDVDNIHRGSITKEDAIRKNIEPMIRAFMKCESNEEDLIRIVKRFVERGRHVNVEEQYGGRERDLFEDEEDFDEDMFNNIL
jgi:DNA topoisomerase-3